MMLASQGREPNSSQEALAVAACNFLMSRHPKYRAEAGDKDKQQRLYIEAAAGFGKSVILALIVVLMQKAYRQIRIVYSNADLLAFEADTIGQLRELVTGCAITTAVAAQLVDQATGKFLCPAHTLTLLDEGDLQLCNPAVRLKGSGAVVSLSAALFEDMLATERLLLGRRNAMGLLRSNFAHAVNENCCEVVASVAEFLRAARTSGKVIYAEADQLTEEALEAMEAQSLRVTHDKFKREYLHDIGPEDVRVVTQAVGMRGFDYRSKAGCGLCLLIARPLPSLVDFKQAAGRIGRWGDPGRRFILAGVPRFTQRPTSELAALNAATAEYVIGAGPRTGGEVK